MISDPVIYDSYEALIAVSKLGNYQPQFVSVMSSNSYWPQIGLSKLFYLNGIEFPGFTFVMIMVGFINTYYVNGSSVKRETFVDYLSEHHPDHFEWFLFHPEYL